MWPNSSLEVCTIPSIASNGYYITFYELKRQLTCCISMPAVVNSLLQNFVTLPLNIFIHVDHVLAVQYAYIGSRLHFSSNKKMRGPFYWCCIWIVLRTFNKLTRGFLEELTHKDRSYFSMKILQILTKNIHS